MTPKKPSPSVSPHSIRWASFNTGAVVVLTGIVAVLMHHGWTERQLMTAGGVAWAIVEGCKRKVRGKA